MPAPKGHPKWGGRKKGSPNKINGEISQRIAESGKDPLAVMLDLLGDRDPSLRFYAAKELLQYQYPKRKAIEIQANVDMNLVREAEEIQNLPTIELKRLIKSAGV